MPSILVPSVWQLVSEGRPRRQERTYSERFLRWIYRQSIMAEVAMAIVSITAATLEAATSLKSYGCGIARDIDDGIAT